MNSFDDKARAGQGDGEELSAKKLASATPPSRGWFKATRSDVAFELWRGNRCAHFLAYAIASRAQWSDTWNRHELQPGEALLGDLDKLGMTAREYRTAKQKLEKWHFATFKTTSRGTIGKLIDTRLFSILPDASDNHDDRQATSERQAGDKRTASRRQANGKQATTTKNLKTAEKAQTAKNEGTVRAELRRPSCSSKSSPVPSRDEVLAFANDRELDPEFVETFLEQRSKDQWTIPNKTTGKAEPIRDWQRVLVAFCAKLDEDRRNPPAKSAERPRRAEALPPKISRNFTTGSTTKL